jgi:F-type H+-transporting ATPase subunit b
MDTAPAFYEHLAQWSEIVGGFAFIAAAVLLFQKYVAPAVRGIQIAGNADLVEAEHRRDALKAEVGKARAELEAADRDARTIKERAQADAGRERERLLSEAQADGERAITNARGELARARLAARAHLRAQLIGRALERARATAAERIDVATNARLVSSTVETLVSDGALSRS